MQSARRLVFLLPMLLCCLLLTLAASSAAEPTTNGLVPLLWEDPEQLTCELCVAMGELALFPQLHVFLESQRWEGVAGTSQEVVIPVETWLDEACERMRRLEHVNPLLPGHRQCEQFMERFGAWARTTMGGHQQRLSDPQQFASLLQQTCDEISFLGCVPGRLQPPEPVADSQPQKQRQQKNQRKRKPKLSRKERAELSCRLCIEVAQDLERFWHWSANSQLQRSDPAKHASWVREQVTHSSRATQDNEYASMADSVLFGQRGQKAIQRLLAEELPRNPWQDAVWPICALHTTFCKGQDHLKPFGTEEREDEPIAK